MTHQSPSEAHGPSQASDTVHQGQLQPGPGGVEAQDRSTVPVAISRDRFQALPEGALLGQEAYYVASIRSESNDCNVYGIEETRPLFPCPNLECGYLENLSQQTACARCATPLNGVMPVHRRHLLREYRNASDVAIVARMAELGLQHPGLLPYRYFRERPYGHQDRYYLVLPDPLPVPASKIKVPQKVARVLDWGYQLAEALAYLHAQHIGWQQVTADSIGLRERQAMWCDFTACRFLAADRAQAAQQQAQDVAELASVICYLATGRNTCQPESELPAAAATVFEQALGEPAEITTASALAEAFRQAAAAIRRPTTLRLRVGRHTDVGMMRDLNEDSLLVMDMDRIQRSISQPIGLYVVADGMGGHAAGDVASGLAVNIMAEKMVTGFLAPQLARETDRQPPDALDWLAEAVQAANQAVYHQRQSANTDMGTTLVAALVVGDTAHIANVGDSRAYLISHDGQMRRITTDHSLVERLVATGQIGPDEARHHPQRNVIYRTIGDKEQVEIDFFVQQLSPGDSLLLCSDGLSGRVEDADMRRLVGRSQSPQEACELLVQAANDRGGDDNITVIIVQASDS